MSDMLTAETREAFVRDSFIPSVADFLLHGDGFALEDASPLGAQRGRILTDLMDRGFMRRSRTGRYWWTGV